VFTPMIARPISAWISPPSPIRASGDPADPRAVMRSAQAHQTCLQQSRTAAPARIARDWRSQRQMAFFVTRPIGA
jgi:hypothetical protein